MGLGGVGGQALKIPYAPQTKPSLTTALLALRFIFSSADQVFSDIAIDNLKIWELL